MKTTTALAALCFAALLSASGCGEPGGSGTRPAATPAGQNFTDFGDFVLHYNAVTTDSLTAEVAQTFGIDRSKSRAMLNVTMIRKVAGTPGESVRGTVAARVSNLTGQLKKFTVREISTGGATYYIGELPVADGEVLNFEISAQPQDEDEPFEVVFQQQFYTE